MTQLQKNLISADLDCVIIAGQSLPDETGEFATSQPRLRALSEALPFGVVEAYAARLSKFYSGANENSGEHPTYSRYEWQLECGGHSQAGEYWKWVVTHIEQARAMWPWDRETAPAVLISRAAGLGVEQASDRAWRVTGLFAASIAQLTFGAELDAWQAGAYVVLTAPQVSNGHSRGELEALPLTVLTHFVAVAVSENGGAPETAEKTSGAMRESERAANHWVQVAQAAGVEAQMTASSAWTLVNGPDVPTISRNDTHSTEVSAWRTAAIGLLEHLRQHLECAPEQWQAKSPGQHLELVRTFYADYRPPVPDFAFTQHYEHSLKVLCQNVGWRVNRVRTSTGEVGQGWQLNRQGHYFTEADAWLAGADRIRRLVMKRANLSYLEWVSLSLDDQISLGLSHAR